MVILWSIVPPNPIILKDQEKSTGTYRYISGTIFVCFFFTWPVSLSGIYGTLLLLLMALTATSRCYTKQQKRKVNYTLFNVFKKTDRVTLLFLMLKKNYSRIKAKCKFVRKNVEFLQLRDFHFFLNSSKIYPT